MLFGIDYYKIFAVKKNDLALENTDIVYTCSIFCKKLKNGRHLSLQMLCRVLAYVDVEVISQTVCKVGLADFGVIVFSDTA
jgi:hypothetical protein